MTQIVVVSNLLPGIADRFINHVVDTTNKALLVTAEAADPHIRRDTGALAANKTFAWATAGNPSGELTYNQDYAVYQNDGTRSMQGTNFANIGVDAATPQFLADLSSLGL